MSEVIVKKTIRIPEELGDALEAEAEARGQKFAAYMRSLIDRRHELVEGSQEQNDLGPVIAEISTTLDHPKFGPETRLAELIRRTSYLQLLVIHLLDEQLGEDRTKVILDHVDGDILDLLKQRKRAG